MHKKDLTPAQQRVLDFIRRHLAAQGLPPTRAEIAAGLGFASANAAEQHLRALARKGVLQLRAGASRGIRLPEEMAGDGALSTPFVTPAPATALTPPVPLLGQVAAGAPLLAEEFIQGRFNIDAGLFGGVMPDFLLRVRGMSMRDAGILDGDLLAVRRQQQARDGQIVVARVGDEVTVKYLRLRGSRVVLQPANADFAPLELDPDREGFAIEGVALGVLRSFA